MTAGPTNVGALFATVKLDVDQALRELRKLDTQLTKTAANLRKISGAGTTASATARTGAAASGGIGDLTGTAAMLAPGRTGQYVLAANSVSKSFQGIKASSALAVGGIAAVGAAALAGGVGLYAYGKAVNAIAQEGIQAAKDLEVLGVSLNAILTGQGATGGSSGEIAWLLELAKVSPLLTETIINMDKFFISQGIASGALRGGLIKAVNDMSAALGLADDRVNSITYALAQVQARGYLSGDELRQLANQFIPVWEALGTMFGETLPNGLEKTRRNLRKLVEEGGVDSEQFFEALIQYSDRYSGAAERQAATLTGLLLKLEDIRKFTLGQAFLDVESIDASRGPIKVLRDLIGSLVESLERIDFAPIAASIGGLMNSLIGPVTEFVNGPGDLLVKLFEEWLPKSIEVTRVTIEFFKQAFSGIGAALYEVLLAGRDFGVILGPVIATGFAAVAISAQAFVAVLGGVASAIRIVIALVKAVGSVLSGNWEAAANSWNEGIDSATNLATSLVDLVASPAKGIKATTNAAIELSNVNLTRFKTGVEGTAEALADLNASATGSSGSGASGGSGGGSGGASAAAKAMDSLFDLTRRWFGLRSELEKGLLGPEGFTATVDQIASMGQKLVVALRDIGASGVEALVARNTLQLIDLANRRIELAERLKEAEGALADAIGARDDFATAVRQGAIDFANALSLETETQRRFKLVSERGFFIEEETTKQKSFVETLRERVSALKEFYANIKALRAAGLDASFLEQLLAAGPDQSGEIAAGLVAGGQAMISEVNTLQGQVTKVADQLGEFGAQEFYQTGVDQAQALVNGLVADLGIIEAAGIDIGETIYEAVLPYAKELREVGKSAGAGFVGGAAGGIESTIRSKLHPATLKWRGEFVNMEDSAEESLGNSLFTIDQWVLDFDKMLGDNLDDVEGWKGSIEDAFGKLKLDINFDFGDLRYKFFDGLLKMWQDIPIAREGRTVRADVLRHRACAVRSEGWFGEDFGWRYPDRDGRTLIAQRVPPQPLVVQRRRQRGVFAGGSRVPGRPRTARYGQDRDGREGSRASRTARAR